MFNVLTNWHRLGVYSDGLDLDAGQGRLMRSRLY